MKKKIIFLIPNLKHGGAEKVLVNLVNNLNTEKFDITIQTLFDVGVHKKSIAPHIKYRSFLPFEFRGNSYLFKLFSAKFWWNLIVKDTYDYAVSYLEGPTSRILSGCTDKNTKKIAWLHTELGTPKLAAQGFASIKEATNAYNSFDKIVAVSQNIKNCFMQQIELNQDLDILYNTNETEQIVEKSLLPINNNRFIIDNIPSICSVSKLMKIKGFDRLLNVHRRLLNEGLTHKVYILGIGEEQGFLESQITKYNLQNTRLHLRTQVQKVK